MRGSTVQPYWLEEVLYASQTSCVVHDITTVADLVEIVKVGCVVPRHSVLPLLHRCHHTGVHRQLNTKHTTK